MPLGVFKVALLGSGAGGESGWVVEPTTSTHGDNWIYDIDLDSDNNVWFTQLASSVSELPIGQVMADGTAGAANNWKRMDPKGGNYGSGRGVAIDDTNGKIYLAGDGISTDNTQYESLLVGMTDGTLVQDWDVKRERNANGFFYTCPITVGADYLGTGRSVFSLPYVYVSGSAHYRALIGENDASDGAQRNQTGGSGGSVVMYYGSYSQSMYPYSVIRATTSSNPWVYAAFRTSTMQRFGFFGNQLNTTTYNRRAYTFYSGSYDPQLGGICECDADYLYMTVQEPGTASELTLLKVAKSDGAISWQRKMIIHNFSSSSTHYTTPPVTDSNGNIYVAWTLADTQSIIGTGYDSMHWASWDSSGNLRTLDGTGVKSFTDTSGYQHYVNTIKVSSDDNFVYICGTTNNPYDPYITKFPTDGTGTDNTAALSGNTDNTYHYRNDFAYTESAGDIEYDSEYGTITNDANWDQVNDDVNDATQASGVAVRLDELA